MTDEKNEERRFGPGDVGFFRREHGACGGAGTRPQDRLHPPHRADARGLYGAGVELGGKLVREQAAILIQRIPVSFTSIASPFLTTS